MPSISVIIYMCWNNVRVADFCHARRKIRHFSCKTKYIFLRNDLNSNDLAAELGYQTKWDGILISCLFSSYCLWRRPKKAMHHRHQQAMICLFYTSRLMFSLTDGLCVLGSGRIWYVWSQGSFHNCLAFPDEEDKSHWDSCCSWYSFCSQPFWSLCCLQPRYIDNWSSTKRPIGFEKLWWIMHNNFFQLTKSSILAIQCAETNERICFLNVTHDEVIRSLFYNKNNDSLITVSVYASDNFSSLKCRSTRIEWVYFLSPCN